MRKLLLLESEGNKDNERIWLPQRADQPGLFWP